MGERKGRDKQRNTNRRLMDTDNGGGLVVGMGRPGRGKKWGKRWENYSSTTLNLKNEKNTVQNKKRI